MQTLNANQLDTKWSSLCSNTLNVIYFMIGIRALDTTLFAIHFLTSGFAPTLGNISNEFQSYFKTKYPLTWHMYDQ